MLKISLNILASFKFQYVICVVIDLDIKISTNLLEAFQLNLLDEKTIIL